MEENCVFCRIIRREIPSVDLYQDDLVLCFLDIAPVSKGHALIIPRQHHVSLTTVPADYLGRMMEVAPRIAAALMRAVDGDGFNLLLANGACAGQVVPHAHLHVIPRRNSDPFALLPDRHDQYEDDREKEQIANMVRKKLADSREWE